ncbi:MAG TPA: cytochrome c3 family protein [Ignavibacteria bacterium]
MDNMKITRLYLLLFTGLLIFLTSTAYFLRETNVKMNEPGSVRYDNSKLIKFNHKLHVKDVGIKCEDCHLKAVTSASSKDNLNPTKPYCATCHDVNDQKNCNFCHYDGVFKKLKATKSELNFSHKKHFTEQKQLCLDCHHDLDNVKFSKEAVLVTPKMETCYSCHDNRKASKNCEGCHTNLTNLKPKNHLSSNFLNEHKVVYDVNSEKNNCMMCHSDNFCQACHSPVSFQGSNTKDDFYAPYYTKENGVRTDRAALQKLSNAHGNMNYRFTHGLDARQKSFECNTCHEPPTFCASCHQEGGDVVTGVIPSSHLQPSFTTLGVNTGGGLHSELAKKDVESCVSCHDVQGRDPVCITCHFDNDGVKGTNPKTHEQGFMSDEKGIWHDTEGAVCFSCHTDNNAKPTGISGVGFCGYCHTGTPQDRRILK